MSVQTLSDIFLSNLETEFDASQPVRTMPGIRLGDAATLVFGFRPTWNPADSSSSPLFPPPVAPTKTFDALIVDNPQAAWSLPVITIHDTVESLVSELYAYRVMPLTPNQPGFSIPAGPLTVDDADRPASLATLGSYLGLDLTKGYSYMLVKARRVNASAVHDFVASYGSEDRSAYLTDAARKAYEQMAVGGSNAKACLGSFYQFGTHFVSRIEAGDMLFQVFAYAASEFTELKAAFQHDSGGADRISGLTALDYQYYTSRFNTETGPAHGYTAEAGKVILWSGDAKFQTSLDKKEWLDSRYAAGNSVFTAYLKPGAGADFLKQFSSVVPVALELTPLAALMNVSTCAGTAQAWHRVFKGAMLHKYGEAVHLAFETIKEFNWAAVFPETTDSWMSTIATPSIDVYQERVDLSRIQLINTDAVKSFTVFAQVVQTGAAGAVQIPGTKPVLAAHIIDSPDTAGVPALQFTEDGLQNLILTCGQMYGALVLRGSGTKHRTVLDGFVYDFGAVDAATKRLMVNLVADIHTPPDEKVALSLASSLQFSLVAAESLLYSRGANAEQRQALITQYLLWLADFIPENTTDPALNQMRVQALYLARVARSLAVEGIEVPYLTYATYKDFVQSTISVAQDMSDRIREYQRQIREQKQLELTAKTAQEINDNIKKTGKLLTDYFAVSAKNQQDMAAYYGQIVTQKQKEFDKSVTDIQKLQDLLAEQQTNVNKAVEDFQRAIIEWEKQEITKFVLQVATDVFSLGTAFLVPASEIKAVASLGETAQKIQKVLNVLNALSKLAVGIDKEIKTLQGIARVLSDIRSDVDMPSAREWQEFSINLDASLAGVPNEPGPAAAKASLSAAFKILVLRGQALLDARSKQRQVLLDLYYNQRLQNVNTDQANRLEALVNALNLGNTSAPDPLRIDLVGLTGQIQFQEKQILAMLAKTLMLQDAAVQYEYLGEPTPITQFDLSSLKTVMMTQQGNILTALSQFNPPPEPVSNPIQYRISGVPVSALSGGSIYQFTIQPSASEFFKYAMVRVNKVLVSISGIESSDGGQYLANLTCQANPFEDRDPQREPLTFHTVQRHFGPYVYDIASGAPQFGDQTGVIAQSFTNITPFSTWLISIPATSTNKGIKFKGQTVDIVLTFKITALYVDPVKRLMRRSSGGMLMAAAVGDQTAPTKDNLLDQMYSSQAVLKGWDAVLNMMEDPVNKFIAAQHQERVKVDGPMVVDVSFCQGPFPSPEGDGSYFAVYTKVNVTLETPLLQFEQNNHDFVTVRQNITGGSITTGSKTVDADYDPSKDCNTTDPAVKWAKPKPLDVSTKPFLSGSVALGVVQGLVKPKRGGSSDSTHSVVLDFAKGSFVAQNLNVHTNNAELNLQLSNYFQTHEITYVINTIDFSDISTLKSLQPTSFKLNVLTTNSKKNILQVFITTDGQQRDNLTINVNEPIPDGYDNSLMINTKIMFQSIFVQSFNQGATNIQVAAVDPQKDFVAWSAKTTQGTVKGTLDFGDKSDNYRLGPGGNEVVWNIANLAFSRDKNQGIVLSYQDRKNVGFQYRQWQSGGRYSRGHWGPWRDHNVDVNVNMTGDYPILIAGQEDLQTIQISQVPPTVNVDNTDLKPTGACECNDNDLKIKVRDLLRDKIPAAIKAQMAGIKFQAISVFALYNLLFPAKQFIKMDEAYVPGDLLVLGHFTKYTSQ